MRARWTSTSSASSAPSAATRRCSWPRTRTTSSPSPCAAARRASPGTSSSRARCRRTCATACSCRSPSRRCAGEIRARTGRSSSEPVAIAGDIVIGLVALLHLYTLVLEMFLWDKPIGMRAFGLTKETAAASRVLAANQGLYNGFLAAGLLWGLLLGSAGTGVKLFFLGCVLVAGVCGAATAGRRILFVQGLPAAIGLALVLLG